MPKASQDYRPPAPQSSRTLCVTSSTVCATLRTSDKFGRKHVLELSVDRPLIIGRSTSACSYVVSDAAVSGIHFKVYAAHTGSGGIMVSCQDHSRHGLYLNGQRVPRTPVVLMQGDAIEICLSNGGSQKFECTHMVKLPHVRTDVFAPSQPSLRTKRIGNYVIKSQCLGNGHFGTVHLALNDSESPPRQVACKTIVRNKDDKITSIMKECRILSKLHHPNINQVYGVHHDDHFLHIFLQLCTGGDLFCYLKSRGRLHDGEVKFIMYQLFQGLKYMHDRSISHRDIKPENILLFSPGPFPHIQIADFGVARTHAYQETLHVCGSVPYLPPEGVLALDHRDKGYVGMPADCWSAGVVMYIMLCGSHPFDYGPDPDDGESQSSQSPSYVADSQASDSDDRQVKCRIVAGHVDFLPRIWETIPDAQSLCARLLLLNPRSRDTIYDALDSTWIQDELPELEDAYRKLVRSD